MPPVSVTAVAGPADLRAFIALPHRLYRDDPHHIGPLRVEDQRRFGPRNPYWQHAEGALFLARRGETVVGRISAQICHLHQQRMGADHGQFGSLDAADAETVTALTEAAEDWLRDRAVRHVTGPFSLSINQECGLLIDGFARPPMLLMPHHPAWLGPALTACGYDKAVDLLAYLYSTDQDLPVRVQAMADRAGRDGSLRLRPLDAKRLRAEIDLVVRLFNDAWSENWGFVPMTEAEINAMADALKPVLVPDLVLFAEQEGAPVAMILALPDINQAIRGLGGRLLPLGWAKLLWRLKVSGVGQCRVLMMGITKSLRNTAAGGGIALWLITELRRRAMARGLTTVELSWVLEENQAMRTIIEGFGARCDKRMRIYRKSLLS